MKRLFAPFSKVEESEDGTIKVWGWASTGTEDEDGETIQPDAIKAALPDYLKWGAVREMHQPKAVGTAIEADVQSDGRTWFGAHVVDPTAVKKVQNNVLKGFSVGGRITGRDEVEKSIITGIKLIEVSLVDRPANPECEIVMIKRSKEAAIDDLAELLKAGSLDPEALLEKADDAKKPYGDVQYADPGYQDDKKKRYPIDTEAHIRAAWNYINKEKNQAQYSASQVASIKRKIIAAWKSKIDKDGPPSASEKLAKGMYNVSQFASCLESLAWVAASSQGDYDWEGDGSPVPEKLREWMADGADIFKEMAAEEVDELVESLTQQASGIIERVQKGDIMELNLAKAGAKFSKETAAKMAAHEEHLGKLHKAMKECASMCKEACDKAADFGHHQPDPDDDGDDDDEGKKAAKAAAAEAAKAAAATPSAKPAQSDLEELAKLIKDAITAATDPLLKRIDTLERQPAGGVPVASAAAAELLKSHGVLPVDKENDGATTTASALANFKPVIESGRVDESATVIKALLDPSRRKYSEHDPRSGAAPQ